MSPDSQGPATPPTARERWRVPAPELARRCDPATLGFTTTADVEALDGVVGQQRAVEAVRFGAGVRGDGFHLYVSGPTGIGKRTLLKTLLGTEAAARPAPAAWCYVHNFDATHRPIAIRLPAGAAHGLRDDMRAAIDGLRQALPAALESQEFQRRVEDIQEELKDKQEEAFAALSKEVEAESLRLVRTPGGFVFAPVRAGEVVSPEQFAQLSEDEQKRIQDAIESAQARLTGIIRSTIEWARQARERVKEAGRALVRSVVDDQFASLHGRYAGEPKVIAHLHAVASDIVEHPEDFRREGGEPQGLPFEIPGMQGRQALSRYEVNVLFDPGSGGGAPLVFEEHPTLANLIGHADYQSRFGALTTDFTLLKAGALHRANGGFLVLDARKVLMQPLAWEALKRALHSREVRIESVGQMLSFLSTVAPEPEPVPLDVKVVLIGDRLLYYLLCSHDPDFRQLFKVQADFDDDVSRSAESEHLSARLVAGVVRSAGLLPFDAAAVARVIDRLGRLADDATKLSAHMGDVVDLVREADHVARRRGAGVVGAADVDEAVAAARRRGGRIRELLLEQVRRGIVGVATDGAAVGQVNGLSVIAYGDTVLGQASRISATARLGSGEVVDIEREARLGGPTHSKGVLILSHFLAQRFARERPLAVSASLVFEQSYGMVDGDSASMGELCALLSALADAPIDQSVAITGSVDQNGRAQAIGGVNEKVEGFFDTCSEHGLTGRQGVVIPASNRAHLMLRDDVVAAVAERRFHVWAVSSVDDAVEILTGVPAGERDADGVWTPGSLGARVEARLDAFFAKRRELSRPDGESKPAATPATEPAEPAPTPPLPGPERGGRPS